MSLHKLAEKIEEANIGYKKPAHGWSCFHCGENFTEFKEAQQHFGKTKDMTSACVLKLCKDPCLVMELRKAEKRVHEQSEQIKELEKQLSDLQTRYDFALADRNRN